MSHPSTDTRTEPSFCFIVNQIDVKADLPVELIPGYHFQRADSEQIKLIKENQTLLRAFSMHAMFYEHDLVETHDDMTKVHGAHNVELPHGRWRYWVITFPDRGSELELLAYGASILKNDLHFGMTILRDAKFPGKMMWRGGFELSYYSNPVRIPFKAPVLEESEIKETGLNYNLIKAIEQASPTLFRIVRRFNYVRSLPQHSEFAFVAYFSVLESLVTHCPKGTESFDSLTHQLKTKMVLLSKRLDRDLDYSVFAGKVTQEKVWAALYSYRSLIAHGEEADFKARDLAPLRDPSVALEFLKEAVKLTILHSLKEPEFMEDLRRC